MEQGREEEMEREKRRNGEKKQWREGARERGRRKLTTVGASEGDAGGELNSDESAEADRTAGWVCKWLLVYWQPQADAATREKETYNGHSRRRGRALRRVFETMSSRVAWNLDYEVMEGGDDNSDESGLSAGTAGIGDVHLTRPLARLCLRRQRMATGFSRMCTGNAFLERR